MAYSATATACCWREHTCVGCGAVYAYKMECQADAKASKAEDAKIAGARAAAKLLGKRIDMQPCPTCGLYQPDMIGSQRAWRHWDIFWVAVVAVVAIVILRARCTLQATTLSWVLVAVCAALGLLYWMFDLNNPNRDPSANRSLASGRVTSGLVRHQPGQSTCVNEELVRPARSLPQKLALVMVLAAVPLAAAPEVMRSMKGWPLNDASYPPIVAPGDTTRVYMNDKIKSVNGYWRGSPVVYLRQEGEKGRGRAIEASSNENSWGSSISGKPSDDATSRRPWVEAQIPNESKLVGKQITLDIQLAVQYPEKSGSSMFNVSRRTMNHQVTLQLADTLQAGSTYNSWWWQAMIVAGGGTVAGGILLIVAARGLQKLANPSRIYPQQAAPSAPAMAGIPPLEQR